MTAQPRPHIPGYLDMPATGSPGPLSPERQRALVGSQRAAALRGNLIEDITMSTLASGGEMGLRHRDGTLAGKLDCGGRGKTNIKFLLPAIQERG